MKVTIKQLFEAEAALRPLLRVRGLSCGVQIGLVRLYRETAREIERQQAREAECAKEFGGVMRGDCVEFPDAGARDLFEKEKERMLADAAEIIPLTVPMGDTLWQTTTPEMMMILDGLIAPEGDV